MESLDWFYRKLLEYFSKERNCYYNLFQPQSTFLRNLLGKNPTQADIVLAQKAFRKLIEDELIYDTNGDNWCTITEKGKNVLISNGKIQSNDDVIDKGEKVTLTYDVFICHASEDKNEVANPLAEHLRESGLNVWYDEFSLKLGDGLRQKIEQGLANSKYGVVILSSNFFKKNWPQKELDGLFAKEIEGDKVILPIWHNITREEILKHSPIIADRVAAKTSEGLNVVISSIIKAINSQRVQEPIREIKQKPLSNISKEETGRNLNTFEELIESQEWKKEIINHKEIWLCELDNTYQIEIGERERDFTEKWTQVYPAKDDSNLYSVYLKINGVIIKQLPFIACDGGRIFVPMPEHKYSKDKKESFHWYRKSLEYKIGVIIGEFYIYKSIEGIAETSGIIIED